MKVDRNATWYKALQIGGVDGEYESPYPNWADVASKGFLAKDQSQDSNNRMSDFGGEGMGTQTAMSAYTRLTQATTGHIVTSDITGGVQTDWLNEIGMDQEVRDGAATVITGMFALVRYGQETDPVAIAGRMAEAGLNMALNFLGAIPIVGWICAAAIAIGKAFYKLKQAADQAARAEPIIVPWQEQSADTDEFIINRVVREIAESGDWTPMWLPRCEVLDSEGWRVYKSSQGDGTRVYGTFDANGTPSYHDPRNGLGVIPNTQMISDFVQFLAPGAADNSEALDAFTNRQDRTVNTGDFYPSVSQLGTTLWSWANRAGSPDMYKIDTWEIEEAWGDYWRTFFINGWDLIKHYNAKKGTRNKDYLDGISIGKALGKFYVLGCNPKYQAGRVDSAACQIGIAPQMLMQVGNMNGPGLSNAGVLHGFGAPGEVNPMLSTWTNGLHKHRWYSPFDAIIMPALKTLRARQQAYLAKSTVCSLVRYEQTQKGSEFAAFADRGPGAYGAAERRALAKRCHDMRGYLLDNIARYTVKDDDVRPVDPKFANELKASKSHAPEFPIAGAPPLDVKPIAGEAVAPDSLPPQGGVPFQATLNFGDLKDTKKTSGGGGGAALLAAAALGAMMLKK